ncbi:MAG: hypothetical protein NZ925_05920, partial [Sulfolobales archaeon]|nr:hypothetical protein [Sulfolobales archaeon]
MNRVEITVVNATPLLVGWYRPELPDPRGLRATEIKGIWRWWARAFVGGALFDLGLLKGSRTKDVLLAPTKDEIECVAKIVGEELGLGMAMGRVSRPSKFSIVVEPLEGPTAERLKKDKLGEWKEAQRIKL